MAMSVVNGYFCASSCDVAKAKKGEDPHPSLHAADAKANGAAAARRDGPAVVFGGALAALTDASPLAPTASTQDSGAATADKPFAVDMLV